MSTAGGPHGGPISQRQFYIDELRTQAFTAFEKLLRLAWIQIGVAAAVILFDGLILVFVIAEWHSIQSIFPRTGGLAQIIAFAFILLFFEFMFMKFYGVQLLHFGRLAAFRSADLLIIMYRSILEQTAEIEYASIKVVHGSDDATLAEISRLSKDMLGSLERYRDTVAELRSKGARYIETTSRLVRGTAFNTMATIFLTIFVAFQVFDLLLNLLQYSRVPTPYANSGTFSTIDHLVLANLSTVTIVVLGASLLVLFVFLLVYLVTRLSVGRAAIIISDVHYRISEIAPPNEEIIRAIAHLIERLVENNIQLARGEP